MEHAPTVRPRDSLEDDFGLTDAASALTVPPMTEYVVTKQGATADWGSNAEGEVQEMPLSKPDGAGWTLHSVLPSQYNVMAIWERETQPKRGALPQPAPVQKREPVQKRKKR